MQLKTLGESLVITKTINEVLTSTAHIGNTYMDNAVRANALAVALKGYSTEAIKAAIAQSSLNAEQIKAILTARGLTDAEIQEVITTNALTASQTGATASAFGLGTAFKGLGLSIKAATKSMIAWMATNPIGWFTAVVSAIGASIYGGVKLHDALTVSLEEQKEKLQETKEAYESVKNELQEVEAELENTQNKIEELENTPNPTWVEQEELNRLREVTKELELQKQLKQDAQLEFAEDLYKENEKTFEKEFKSSYGNTSIADMKEQLAYGHIGTGQLDYENITDIVSALQYINEEKAKLTDESEIAEYENLINDLTELVKSEGQEYLSSLSEYKQNIFEIASIRDLTEDEQEFYDYLSSMQKAIYEYYSPATWNSLEFDSVFNTEGIEKTKEELVSMYKAGELSSVEMLEQFPKLYKAIKESEIITGEGSNAFKEFYNEIAALAEDTSDTVADTNESISTSRSITDTIKQLNTQLKPTFDSLKSAYQDIFTTDDNGKPLFTLENVDLSMLDSIKSAIDELNENEELGIYIDYSEFENLAMVLADTSSTADEVQEAFNSFATDILNATTATDGMTQETAQLVEQMLESLGVTNANEIALNALREAKAQSILTTYDLAGATNEEFAAILAEGEAAGLTEQQIYSLTAAEIAFGNNDLSVEGKIGKLRDLASAYGDTASAALATAVANDLASGHTDVDAAINDIMAKINTGVKKAEINFSPETKSKSKKSGGSSKKEEDKWLEEYKKKLAELQNLLDKGLINEREFFSQSETLLNTYLKDSEEHMTKYAEEISDAEKTLHGNMVSAYQYEADELGRLRDKNYLSITQWYQSMMNLQDSYYNSEALKLKNLADTMEAEYGRMSHINITRPSVDASQIQAAGYATELESSSFYAQSFGNEEKQVIVTPILPDGTILSPEALTDYADKLLKGQKIDADIELSMFDGKDAVKQAAEYVSGLEKISGEYQNIKKAFAESPYGDFTEEQLEALEALTEDIEKHKSQLSSELGDIKSAYDGLIEIRDTYNEYGKISVDQYQSLCDMGFEYLALLSDENGALSLDEEAFQRLTDAKVQQMQVDMALQAADLINNIQTEAQAVEYLAASYNTLKNEALSAAEAMLYAAQQNAQLLYGAESKQAQAAATIVKGYENSKLLVGSVGKVDIKMESGGGYPKPKEEKEKKEKEDKEKEEKENQKQFDWIATLLDRISSKVSKLTDKIEKFYNWQKKNLMITRTVKANNEQITHEQNAYQMYMRKAKSVGLPSSYVKKIQDGTLNIETIKYYDEDEKAKLVEQIEAYEEWYDKAQNCLDTINDLYDTQRDLIKQKLSNVLDYYSDMDSYLTSITSKIESLISLNEQMGKRSSLTELVEQFAALSDQKDSATQKEIGGVTITEGSLGDSKKVADAVNRDRQELADAINDKIINLEADQSGTYTKLLNNIAKTEAQIDKYIDKGWDVKKEKQFEKLTKKLENYYDLQAELDQYATSDTITNYNRIYTAYQKLQDKLNSKGKLSKSEQKKYDSYEQLLEDLRNKGQESLDKLYGELAEANGTAPKKSEADKIKENISGVHSGLENSATYQNLLKDIEKVEDKIEKLDEKGYDNLSKNQKKTYDKLQAQLEAYYTQKESLDENATAANIAEYNKIYLAWKKLQNKLDKGGNLSTAQWKKYNQYTEQMENFAKEKADTLDKLSDDLEEALNPSDKLDKIQKTYEEAAEGIYESYHNQIDDINEEATDTQQYQNLLAKAQKLEQKKDTKGLSKSEQATLDKYNAELEALQKGGTGNNISEYMKTWEAWYKLQQKLDSGKKLSASEAKNYDTYKAKLEAWNNEKQTQINDLLSLMEDDLEQLQKTYTENVSEAESDTSDYFANLYSLAKQIAEYNLSTLKAQLEYLDSYIGYYKELVSLYDTFSGDKLTKLLTDLDEDAIKTKVEAYGEYLDILQDKYNTTLSEMNEYGQLLDALDTNDFEASMELFNKALESYRQNGDTVMAGKLQSVLDLLNERAIDADNWDEFADQWATEWEKEFASAKQELIGTATEIQNVNDALRNAKFENITNAISELDTAKGILSSIADLIQDEWLYDNGELSEYGQAKAALLVSQLEDSQKKADAYLNLYKEIQNNKDTYASDKAYMEDLNNALQNYYNTLGESAALENSIVELMKHSAQEEINNIKKIIEARKKALAAKKEYADYDKNIKNSQKEIDIIKAQIDALENLSDSTDAAAKAKLAQLKAELEEKEKSLQETKDEHTYKLQIDALDEFAASLEDSLNNSTKSLEEIMKEYKDTIDNATEIYKTSTDSVNDTLQKLKEFYSGAGTTTDGSDLDLMPKTTAVVSEDTIPAAVAAYNLSDSNSNTEEDVNQVIKENMAKAAELFEKFGYSSMTEEQKHKEFFPNLHKYTAQNFQAAPITIPNQFVVPKPSIPESVKNKEVQPVVNIHYDNLINVEGSVDKSFSKEFTQNSDKMYKDFTNKLVKDLKHYGVNITRRPTLPTVM